MRKHVPGCRRYAPDSSYAWLRLAVALLLGTVACVGTWSVVVVLPSMQGEFGTLRAGASLPYTCAMLGFGVGNIVMGRVADRYGIVVPIVIGALLLGAGYIAGRHVAIALAVRARARAADRHGQRRRVSRR